MLKNLLIRNYALIDELEISFSDELTIITGETGAGKSILLGALSLLLGSRSDQGALFDSTKKCVVEGEFDIRKYDLKDIFNSNDLDWEPVTTIRREINPEGKSRAFINDTPVTVSVLKSIGPKLIEIHSQHETLTLNDSEFQMIVVDAVAECIDQVRNFTEKYSDYSKKVKKLNILKTDQEKSNKDLDYYTFLFKEIEEAGLSHEEQEMLEKELELLNNSSEIKEVLGTSFQIIDGEEDSLLSGLNSLLMRLNSISGVLPEAGELVSRIKSTHVELKDIGDELDSVYHRINPDPSRMQIVSDRLDLIYSLEKKHRVSSTAELLQIRDELDSKINLIDSLESAIEKLETETGKIFTELVKEAEVISKKRSAAVQGIEKQVKELLSGLGMPHAVLKVEIINLQPEQLRKNGLNTVKFMFSANKGVKYMELNKVASGGELSRLMLSIKSILARYSGLPTIIFDEIDTGISGEVAAKAGNLVQSIGTERQVIAITHLPQMAVKGKDHLFVYKETSGKVAKTRIRKLSEEERVSEIAKMLSGESPTKSAIANARDLLGV